MGSNGSSVPKTASSLPVCALFVQAERRQRDWLRVGAGAREADGANLVLVLVLVLVLIATAPSENSLGLDLPLVLRMLDLELGERGKLAKLGTQ